MQAWLGKWLDILIMDIAGSVLAASITVWKWMTGDEPSLMLDHKDGDQLTIAGKICGRLRRESRRGIASFGRITQLAIEAFAVRPVSVKGGEQRFTVRVSNVSSDSLIRLKKPLRPMKQPLASCLVSSIGIHTRDRR
jgi:hypothetical protein